MEIWFYLPFGAFAPKLRRIVPNDPPHRPDFGPASREARRSLSGKLSPRLMKDIGLGDD